MVMLKYPSGNLVFALRGRKRKQFQKKKINHSWNSILFASFLFKIEDIKI